LPTSSARIATPFSALALSADIDKGARWSLDVASRLEQARLGIICLTPANLHSDWLLFEAGALSKTVKSTYVCPLLLDLQPAELHGPLAQFQATRATADEILKLHEISFGGPSSFTFHRRAAMGGRHQANMRAYMWFRLKEWLGKGRSRTRRGWRINWRVRGVTSIRGGKLVIESKAEMAKRGVASPEDADALALTFACSVAAAVGPGSERHGALRTDCGISGNSFDTRL
jgi:hypothetical protein